MIHATILNIRTPYNHKHVKIRERVKTRATEQEILAITIKKRLIHRMHERVLQVTEKKKDNSI